MKKKTLYTFGLLVLSVLYTQCVFEETPEISVPQNLSFNADIVPIFEASCNSATCHDTGGARPDLSPENAWTSLQSGYLNLTDPPSSELVEVMDGGSMAPYSKEQDIALIIQWIKTGALNN